MCFEGAKGESWQVKGSGMETGDGAVVRELDLERIGYWELVETRAGENEKMAGGTAADNDRKDVVGTTLGLDFWKGK